MGLIFPSMHHVAQHAQYVLECAQLRRSLANQLCMIHALACLLGLYGLGVSRRGVVGGSRGAGDIFLGVKEGRFVNRQGVSAGWQHQKAGQAGALQPRLCHTQR